MIPGERHDTYGSSTADPIVGIVRTRQAGYDLTLVREEVVRLLDVLGWSHPARGPFGSVVPAGAKVLVKPNWVNHRNYAPHGIEPLLTHAAVIQSVVQLLLESGVQAVTLGDAPIQGCDFEHMIDVTGLRQWSDDLQARESRYRGMLDFRRTKSVVRSGVREARENLVPEGEFVLFDLGRESLHLTLRSSTSGCRPRTRTRAPVQPWSSGRRTTTSASCCCRSRWRRATSPTSYARIRDASATC
jgi:hypothetical protein